VLVEFGVLALLVGGCHELMALFLDPFPDTQLVLGSTKELGFLLGVDTTLRGIVSNVL